jgi:hypothetical protein
MKKADIIKAIGGASVMIAVFFLIAIVSNFNLVIDGAKYAFGGNNEDFKQTTLVYSGRAFAPEGVVEGFFDTQRDGDITTTGQEEGKEVTYHYRAIHSDEIKNSENNPILKLQVFDNNKQSWKETKITKINHTDGTVYFLLKLEENGTITPNDYYTGTYQLFFE